MRLDKMRAIVTGGARGIGRAVARRFIAEGARVMLGDVNAEELRATARELGCAMLVTDVARKADIDRLVKSAIEEFGGVDILVNNAGVTHAAEFLDLTEADFDRVLAINLKSALLASQAAARDMIPRRS